MRSEMEVKEIDDNHMAPSNANAARSRSHGVFGWNLGLGLLADMLGICCALRTSDSCDSPIIRRLGRMHMRAVYERDNEVENITPSVDAFRSRFASENGRKRRGCLDRELAFQTCHDKEEHLCLAHADNAPIDYQLTTDSFRDLERSADTLLEFNTPARCFYFPDTEGR